MANNYLGSFATGTIAQGIQIGSALALLPIIGVYLSPDEIGVWYLLLTFQSLILLVDSGSSQGFVRFYSLARSGASRFTEDGFDISDASGSNIDLLSRLLRLNRSLHRLLAFLFLLLSLPLIWGIVLGGYSNDIESTTIGFGVALFGFGSAVYLSASWMSAFLFSMQLQSIFFRFLILYRLLFLTIAAALLLLEQGVFGLGFANLLSALVSVLYLRSRFRSAEPDGTSSVASDWGLFRDIWKVWAKNVVVALGGFLGNRGVLIIVAATYGLSDAGMFGISMQLFFAVLAVSQLVFQISAPRMSELRVRNKLAELRSYVTRLSIYFMLLFTAGAVTVILVVPPILSRFDSNIQLLALGPLIFMALVYALEGNHSNYALAISTENKIPYFIPSIITATAIVIGTAVVSYSGLPIAWVLVVQGVAHLLYNNWKWPVMFYGYTRSTSRT